MRRDDPLSELAPRSRAVGLAKAALVRGQVLAGAFRGSATRPGLRILYYHRVSVDRDPLAVTPDAFRRQMDAIAETGQRVVDLYEIDDLQLAPGEAAYALTFDDGYRDVLENALPVMREHGFPSTVFVVPGAIAGETAFWWYPPGAMPPIAGWDELRAEERAGLVRFEPHTLTHPVLTELTAMEARRRSRARWRSSHASSAAPRACSATRGLLLAARDRAHARVRPARRADLRVRRQPHAVRPLRDAPDDRRALGSAVAVPRAARRCDRRAAARSPTPPRRAASCVTPRLLVIVTLAEAGGAQTFVTTLVAGLRERYAIEVASHGPDGALVDACAALDVPFHHVRHLVRDPHPYHDAAAVRELRSLARALAPDVVQINSSKAGVLARLALARVGAKTCSPRTAGRSRAGAARRAAVYATAERAVAPLSDAIVCVSNHDLELAHDRNIKPRGELHVIHNGVDAPAVPPLAGLPASGSCSVAPRGSPRPRISSPCSTRSPSPAASAGICASSATAPIARRSSGTATSWAWPAASRCSATATTSPPSSPSATPSR